MEELINKLELLIRTENKNEIDSLSFEIPHLLNRIDGYFSEDTNTSNIIKNEITSLVIKYGLNPKNKEDLKFRILFLKQHV
jgi:hypothetical protein